MEMLNLGEKLVIDESIEEYEYHEHVSDSGNMKLNQGGEIRIPINAEDTFLHISNSYLLFDGQLVNNNGVVITDANTAAKKEYTTLINNALMFLFSEIKYELSGQTIEQIANPGETTTMMGTLRYTEAFEKSLGMNQGWCGERMWDPKGGLERRYAAITTKSNPKGYFSFSIPLKHIFGFVETYDKVMFGFKHQLSLYRKSSDQDAIIKKTTTITDSVATHKQEMVDSCKVRLDKLSWFIPHVLPSLENKVKLMKEIESKTNYEVGYKMLQSETISVPQTTHFDWRLSVKSSPEKPRYIVIGFQNTGKVNFDKATFDHLNLKNIFVYLNSRRYPKIDYEIDFEKNQYSRLFKEAATFKEKYYGLDELLSSVNLTRFEYKDHYPLFVIDVSKQSDKIKNGVTDIRVKAFFAENAPANANAYAVLISDKIVTFKSDGSKFSVIQ